MLARALMSGLTDGETKWLSDHPFKNTAHERVTLAGGLRRVTRLEQRVIRA